MLERCRVRHLAIVLAIQLLGVSGDAVKAQDKASLTLAGIGATPGSEVRFTVMFTNRPGGEVSQLRQWIEFPKNTLSYVGARLSIAAELAEAELKADVKDKSDAPDIGILTISIIGKKSLSDGPVAELIFEVPSTVPEQTLTLNHRAEGVGLDGKTLSEVAAEGGSLKISKEPVEVAPGLFSCFFYMH